MAEPTIVTDLSQQQSSDDWRFFTDGVMGGVSEGRAVIDDGALRMTGDVSTKNNGGFIQARFSDVALPADATALVIRVRGDGQTYFIHLRTTDTRRPWNYYQASFTAPAEWTEITLDLASFERSHRILPAVPKAANVTSVALVAYGRNHMADVSLSRIGAE